MFISAPNFDSPRRHIRLNSIIDSNFSYEQLGFLCGNISSSFVVQFLIARGVPRLKEYFLICQRSIESTLTQSLLKRCIDWDSSKSFTPMFTNNAVSPLTEEIYSFFLTPSDIFTGRNIHGNPFHQVLGQKILLNLTCLIARLSNSGKGPRYN